MSDTPIESLASLKPFPEALQKLKGLRIMSVESFRCRMKTQVEQEAMRRYMGISEEAMKRVVEEAIVIAPVLPEPQRRPLGGALIPPGAEWQDGKTAATIAFVNEAEAALTARSDLTEAEAYQLRTLIEILKEGQTSLEESETLDGWLERLRDHYP